MPRRSLIISIILGCALLLQACVSAQDDDDVANAKYWAGDWQTARPIMTRLANEGDPRAEFWMGARSLDGWAHVPRDEQAAVKWISLFAEHGYAPAQFNLGVMYRDGRHGLPKYTEAARMWFKRAADQGDSAARSELSLL